MAAPAALRLMFPRTDCDLEQLQAELIAAGLPVVGTCGSPDGVEVLLSEDVPGAAALCGSVVEAHTPRTETQRRNQQALATIFGGTDPLHVALRAIFSDIYTQINDVREHDFRDGPLPRILEPAIMARLVAGLVSGARVDISALSGWAQLRPAP